METKSFDVVIIGAGPSGLLAAIMASKNRHVLLVEQGGKSFELGKRILVSGNGRANFFNEELLNKDCYSKYPLNEIKDFVWSDITPVDFINYLEKDLGFLYKKEDNLYYPYFNRSECLQNLLVQQLKNNNITIKQGKLISIDSGNNSVVIKNNENTISKFKYNDLILAIGAKSLDRNDYNDFLLSSLNVKSYPFKPCLCPIKVKEPLPSYLNKNRLRGRLSLYHNDELIYQEDGELLFKDDGISGICVFNSTLYLNEYQRRHKTNDFTYEFQYLEAGKSISYSSYPYFLRRYLSENKNAEPGKFRFTFAELYPFSQSQISYGGILLSEINKEDFSLKDHPDIHIIGEMLDQNFICGGYNMGTALIEGYILGRRLAK